MVLIAEYAASFNEPSIACLGSSPVSLEDNQRLSPEAYTRND